LLNNRGPVSTVQKAGRVANKARKTVEISQDKEVEVALELIIVEPVVVAKRAKKVAARSRALRRLTRKVVKTARARSNNTK
jgi:VIT1/CCC1 family predicted Fe2+/Mn2+ transporter